MTLYVVHWPVRESGCPGHRLTRTEFVSLPLRSPTDIKILRDIIVTTTFELPTRRKGFSASEYNVLLMNVTLLVR